MQTAIPPPRRSRDAGATPTSALHLLHRAGQRADELFATNVGDSGLTPRQFAVLVAIVERDNPSQTEIVEVTGIDRSTLADIVRRLVDRGMVRRRRTREDARMYALNLTDEGKAAVRNARPAAQSLLSMISQRDRETFLAVLEKIAQKTGG